MPSTYIATYARYSWGGAYTNFRFQNEWSRSPRVNGKLQLRANPWSLTLFQQRSQDYCPPGWEVYPAAYFHVDLTTPQIVRARATAGSDLRGRLARKVREGNVGALGVSIATAGQSVSMLAKSGTALTNIIGAAATVLQTVRGRKRLRRLRSIVRSGADPTAGMVLQGFFGWAPLYQDMVSACETIANPWPPGWVSSSQSWDVPLISGSREAGAWKITWRASAKGRETYSTRVEVGNPNTWILAKLGLLNAPGIAWDLIPWSFLVNMFSNMGQVMGSLTDFSGLILRDSSLTSATFILEQSRTSDTHPTYGTAWASGNFNHKRRSREVGVPPPGVRPYLKFPNWSVSTAAISGALLVQQVHRLDRIVKGL